MNKLISRPDAATGKTTAMRFLLPNEKFAIAYGNFANIYNEVKAYSKHIGLDVFDAESRYTFATDMAFYSSTKEIDAYINRTNGFGPLHDADDNTAYQSPGIWRSKDDKWCYEYRLKKEGILVSPILSELK